MAQALILSQVTRQIYKSVLSNSIRNGKIICREQLQIQSYEKHLSNIRMIQTTCNTYGSDRSDNSIKKNSDCDKKDPCKDKKDDDKDMGGSIFKRFGDKVFKTLSIRRKTNCDKIEDNVVNSAPDTTQKVCKEDKFLNKPNDACNNVSKTSAVDCKNQPSVTSANTVQPIAPPTTSCNTVTPVAQPVSSGNKVKPDTSSWSDFSSDSDSSPDIKKFPTVVINPISQAQNKDVKVPTIGAPPPITGTLRDIGSLGNSSNSCDKVARVATVKTNCPPKIPPRSEPVESACPPKQTPPPAPVKSACPPKIPPRPAPVKSASPPKQPPPPAPVKSSCPPKIPPRPAPVKSVCPPKQPPPPASVKSACPPKIPPPPTSNSCDKVTPVSQPVSSCNKVTPVSKPVSSGNKVKPDTSSWSDFSSDSDSSQDTKKIPTLLINPISQAQTTNVKIPTIKGPPPIAGKLRDIGSLSNLKNSCDKVAHVARVNTDCPPKQQPPPSPVKSACPPKEPPPPPAPVKSTCPPKQPQPAPVKSACLPKQTPPAPVKSKKRQAPLPPTARGESFCPPKAHASAQGDQPPPPLPKTPPPVCTNAEAAAASTVTVTTVTAPLKLAAASMVKKPSCPENFKLKINEERFEFKQCNFQDPKGPDFHEGFEHGERKEFNDKFSYNSEFTYTKKKELDDIARKRITECGDDNLYSQFIGGNDTGVFRSIDPRIIKYGRSVPHYDELILNDEMFTTDVNELYFQRIIERNRRANWLPKICFARTEFLNGYELFEKEQVKIEEIYKTPNETDEDAKHKEIMTKDFFNQGETIHKLKHFLDSCNGTPANKCEILFFPAYHGYISVMHHTLFVVDFPLQRILHFNPLEDNSYYCESTAYYLNVIHSILSCNARAHTGNDYNWNEWCFGEVRGMPYQPLGNGCGPFICNYAEFYSRRAPIDFANNLNANVNIRYRIMRAIMLDHIGIPGGPSA